MDNISAPQRQNRSPLVSSGSARAKLKRQESNIYIYTPLPTAPNIVPVIFSSLERRVYLQETILKQI